MFRPLAARASWLLLAGVYAVVFASRLGRVCPAVSRWEWGAAWRLDSAPERLW